MPTRYIIKASDTDFFSNFNAVLNHLVYNVGPGDLCQVDWSIKDIWRSYTNQRRIAARKGTSNPLIADQIRSERLVSFPYGTEADGNIWDHCFERLPFHANTVETYSEVDVRTPDLNDSSFCGVKFWDLQNVDLFSPENQEWRRSYHEIFRQYICLKPHLEKRINAFYDRHMKGKFCVGIYVGDELHRIEQPNNQIAAVGDYIAKINGLYSDQCPVIFAATDEQAIAEKLKHEFGPQLVLQDDILRDPKGSDKLLNSCREPDLLLGEGAISDCWLLSKCDVMLHVASSIDMAVAYINPKVEMIYMETDYVSGLGQDRWVMTEVFPGKRGGYFVEAGAKDGFHLSNTLLLETKCGWQGLCIEPGKEFGNLKNSGRKCEFSDTLLGEADGLELPFRDDPELPELSGTPEFMLDDRKQRAGTVTLKKTRTLASVLDEHQAPAQIDYLSLDTEGSEYLILRNFPFDRYRFGAITVEHNGNQTEQQKIHDLLTENGYRRVHSKYCEDWYVPVLENLNFGKTFDGYCVIHAPYATAERRVWFERELERVGVDHYTIIEPSQIKAHDKRLEYFGNDTPTARAQISIAEVVKKCIDFAKSKKWKNVVIFEDDILFRKEFKTWWPEVEGEIEQYDWDILFLYRWAGELLAEQSIQTNLIPIQKTLCTHCFVVREDFYSVYQNAIDYSLQNGNPIDTDFTFEYLNKKGCRIVATSKNLAGQRCNFRSSVTGALRPNTLQEAFRVEDANGYRIINAANKHDATNRFFHSMGEG